MHHGDPTRLFHTGNNRVDVDGPQRAQVNHLTLDALFGHFGRGVQGLIQHRAVGEYGDVATGAHHGGLAQRDAVVATGDLTLGRAVHAFGFEKYNRIRIGDRGEQQTFGIVGVGGDDHLDPRQAHELHLWVLRVVMATPDPSAHWRTNHHAGREFTATSVAILGQLIDHLLIGRPQEIRELDLWYWNHPVHGHAHRRPNDAIFGERSINHSIGTKLVIQARGHPKYTTDLAHVLAEQDHTPVRAHRDSERVIDGLHHVHL